MKDAAALRALCDAAKPDGDETECARCHETFSVDPGCEPTRWCHPCAQEIAAEVPALLGRVAAAEKRAEEAERENATCDRDEQFVRAEAAEAKLAVAVAALTRIVDAGPEFRTLAREALAAVEGKP